MSYILWGYSKDIHTLFGGKSVAMEIPELEDFWEDRTTAGFPAMELMTPEGKKH